MTHEQQRPHPDPQTQAYPHVQGYPQGQGYPHAPSGHAPTTALPAAETGSGGGALRVLLHVAAVVLVAAGLSLPLDGEGVFWGTSGTWAAFAAAAALAQLAGLGGRGAMGGRAWWVAAAGAGALVLFWALLMLPVISTNMAFLVTLGTAASATAVVMSPDRRF